MSIINYFITGANESKGNAKHWFRYLRKMIKNDKIIISNNDINELLNSNELSMFQKITLERVILTYSPTFKYVSSLNKPAKLNYYNTLRSEINDQK